MSGVELPFAALLPEGDEKACCASVYEAPAVRWLLGDSFHPGGAELTMRTAQLAGVSRGSRVLDVASGRGATAQLLASGLGAEVVGVELGAGSVAEARSSAAEAELAGQVTFVEGDAESLPFADDEFDAVMSECSLCTFVDKPAAAAEMARVLRPGGRVAVADVTAERDRLPPQLRTAAARVACIADALPAAGYRGLLEEAGLQVETVEDHEQAVLAMVDRIEARLRVARMIGAAELEPFREELGAAIELSRLARGAVVEGHLGYAVFSARLALIEPPESAPGPARRSC